LHKPGRDGIERRKGWGDVGAQSTASDQTQGDVNVQGQEGISTAAATATMMGTTTTTKREEVEEGMMKEREGGGEGEGVGDEGVGWVRPNIPDGKTHQKWRRPSNTHRKREPGEPGER